MVNFALAVDTASLFAYMKRFLTCLCALLCAVSLDASVPTGQFHFSRISQEDGLPSASVRAICRDGRGFLWLGTTHGLSRYDGRTVRTWYRADLGLDSDYITDLMLDRSGRLWILTGSGVSVYDPQAERFSTLGALCGEPLDGDTWHVSDDPQGRVWLSVNGEGLLAVDPDDWTVSRLFVEDGKQVLPSNVSALFKDEARGIFLLGLYGNGLWETDAAGSFLRPWQDGSGGEPFRGQTVLSIFPKQGAALWVLASDHRLVEVDPYVRTAATVPLDFPEKAHLRKGVKVDDTVAAFLTNAGIFFYDWSDGTLQHLSATSDRRYGLSGNSILCLAGNLREGLVVGTRTDGISIQQRPPFASETWSGPLAGSRVSGIAQTPDGRVWVATEQAGLFVFADRVVKAVPTRLIPKSLSTLMRDGDDLWLMTLSGVYRYDTRTGRETVIPWKRRSNGPLYRCSDGTILAGTVSGVFRYDEGSGRFVKTRYLPGLKVCSILEDGRGRLWFGNFKDGLYCFDGGGQTHFVHDPDDPRSLPSDRIHSLMEDRDGQVWVVPFGQGIARLDGDGFVRRSVRDGLSSDLCQNMLQDRDGGLWVATEFGLNQIRPDGSILAFHRRDGLLNNGFSLDAAAVLMDGSLLLGSRDGLVRIDPSLEQDTDPEPYLGVTTLWVGGEEILPGGEDGLLSASIAATSHLVLPYDHRSFALSFSLIDRTSPGAGTMYYRMDGYIDAWTELRGSRTVTFPNMPPGRYVLRLKGVSGRGTWNEDVPPLEIVVKPPFYRTGWAFLLYGLLALGAGAAAFMALRQREARRRKELEDRLKLEMNEGRLDIFRGIVHEIKTPLTLIKTPLEDVMARDGWPEDVQRDLRTMEKNADYLTELSDELLYYTRVEKSGFQLHAQPLDLGDQLSFLLLNYRQAFEQQGIQVTLAVPEGLWVHADRAGLAKIVNNLISNALKYASGTLSITAEAEGEDRVVVRFCNDGPVIPASMRSAVFDSFVRGEEGKGVSGFGIGLSVARTLANLHGGSLEMDGDLTCNRFLLTLPRDPAVPEPADLSPEAGEPRERGRRILVVEDNAELRAYICRKLEARYTVLQAADGAEAMELVRTEEGIDVVVTDLSMPRMDGLALCNAIKEDFTFSHILVIILSAHLTGEAMIESMDSRADLLVSKPFSMEYLLSCIESLTRNREDRLRWVQQTADVTVEAAQEEGSGLSVRDEMFIRNLSRVVEENLSDPDFSIERLAGALRISKTTLKRKVRDLLDTSPNDYIREHRLLRAERLLVTSSDRISEICYATGFQTPSYFAKCFKAKYGLSPQDYLKSRRP